MFIYKCVSNYAIIIIINRILVSEISAVKTDAANTSRDLHSFGCLLLSRMTRIVFCDLRIVLASINFLHESLRFNVTFGEFVLITRLRNVLVLHNSLSHLKHYKFLT